MLVWPFFISYTFLVFFLAVQPGRNISPFFSQHDKLLHALEYAFLFGAATAAFYRSFIGRRFAAAHAAMVYCLAIATATELLQLAVPTREASFLDFVADASGAGAAMGVLWCWKHKLPGGLFSSS